MQWRRLLVQKIFCYYFIHYINIDFCFSGPKAKVLSPTSVTQKRTSPIPVAGATASGGTPRGRQRSESTCSTASTVSWQLITESGSVERDQLTLRPQ